jgi:aspartyl-tRNA(Asn)/glutamyl-tRNA(Gln) amidotransferase subunit A
VPRVHALPPLLLDFEVIGSIARGTADVQALHGVLAGADRADRRSFAAVAAARALPSTLRVRVVETLDDAPVDAAIGASCRAFADALVRLGHTVEHGPLPLDLAPLNAGWPQVGQAGLAWLFRQHPEWRAGAGARYLELAALGERLDAAWLWQAIEVAEQLRRDVAALFDDGGIDLIVMPSAAALPWPAEQPFPPRIDGREVGPRGHAVFTGWVNAAGLPALALPTAPSPAGLPIGVQLIAPYGADAALLALGAALEVAGVVKPWRWPPAPFG